MAVEKEFPYATSLTGLKRILEGIPTWGTPDKVTGEWLAGVGFAGGAAARSLGVLRAVGVVDSGGKPTELWAALRTKDRAKFAAGLRKHYAALFGTYSDAHRKDTEALLAFVRSKTSYGDVAQRKAVATFKALCEFGDFDADVPGHDEIEEPEEAPKAEKAKTPKAKANASVGNGVALTVNLQLQLPASENGDVYEKLFAAMGKHLKGLIGTE
jgi:hypothetical protein